MDEYRRKLLLDNAVEMYDLLKEHQWAERDGTTCPECYGCCPNHNEGCRLAAVLCAVSPAAIVGSREPFPTQVKQITGVPGQPLRVE